MNTIYTGVTGMLANQQAIDVIANNISNLNTVGYKASRITFEEALVRTLSPGNSGGVNPMQVGMGAVTSTIDNLMSQVGTRSTGRPLDLAVVGEGFFSVFDGVNRHFTRDGVFQLDDQNRLVMGSNGMTVNGWQADILNGTIDTSVPVANEITIPLGSMYAVATSKVNFGGNLNAAAAVGDTVNSSFDIVDSLGTLHKVDVQFAKTGDNAWSWTATCDDAAATTTPGTGTITFNANGQVVGSTGSVSLDLSAANGATDPVNFTLDFSSTNQLDGSNSIQASSQNGFSAGILESYDIQADGTIIGSFSSGTSRTVGQLALAHFVNPAGLMREGNNLWNVSPNSGTAVISTAEQTGAQIRSGYLEMSNVDLTTEFANLIVSQRGFQANSRSITTSDEMMQDILQLKR